MAKLTNKKYQEYKAININGFKVNLGRLLYQFAHGDQYPELRQSVLKENNIELILSIDYFKFYDGHGEYRIKASENKIEGNFLISGTGYFEKAYHQEQTVKGQKFNFNHLKELANKFNIDELKQTALKDYETFKSNKN